MTIRKPYIFAAASAAALIAAGVYAHEASGPLPGSMNTTHITGGTYTADPAHTLVGWRVNHFGFNDYFGIFGNVTGTLTFDKTNPAASSVNVTIPVGDVTVASAGLREHLLRDGKDGTKPDFFGSNPGEARFVSTAVVFDDDDTTEADVLGNLTLNGITKPVRLEVEFTGAGANPFTKKETIGFEAETTIRRSDFGILYGLPVVSDRVELEISAAFEK